jgi:Ran GTPase-activating protein (RanGAP) involved in mRNA processing and transport
MPIDKGLLERIRVNDSTLKILDLSSQKLNAQGIRQLVNALASNTTLTSLDVGNNQIGDEGAKALAANATLTSLDVWSNQIGDEGAKALATNATLASLKVRYNQIGDEGAKALAANATLTSLNIGNNLIGAEGAKALAANATLTSLDVGYNQIGAEGVKALAANATLTSLDISDNQIGAEEAKALAANVTLTSLDVWSNQIGDEIENLLKQVIACNNKNIIMRRDQFIQKLILLAHAKADSESQPLWSTLPKELKLHIINFIDFRSTESIGKSPQQIKACAAFIFNNILPLKESLTESLSIKQDFKVKEKIVSGKSQFWFFPPKPPMKLPKNISSIKESNEPPKKFQKLI